VDMGQGCQQAVAFNGLASLHTYVLLPVVDCILPNAAVTSYRLARTMCQLSAPQQRLCPSI
jgi:hypothetical protein